MKITVDNAMKYASAIILGADYGLYQHSVNVANICYPACIEMGLDERLGFVSGLLHDCGKVEWLHDPLGWSFMDHPVLSYGMLKDTDIEVATIAYMHHMYQMNTYPAVCEINVPKELEPYCQLISFADKIEANMTRSHATAESAIRTMKKLYDFMPEVVTAVSNVVEKKSPYRVI